MKNRKFSEAVEMHPIIAAVKDKKGLKKCCQSEDIQVVFILFGDICSIAEIVDKVKKAGKTAMVHVDLINGLGSKEIVVDYIRSHTKADGIISTKPALIRRAEELSLYTVLRIFLIDSMALEGIKKQQQSVQPDFIEVLPGVMPKIIRHISQMVDTPIIAGGLIRTKEDVMEGLEAGAVAVSSTNSLVWEM